MTGTAPDITRQEWSAFRKRWTHTITSLGGLFSYDPVAREHLMTDGVEVYDYDPTWVLPARFEPSPGPETLDLQIAHHDGTKRVPRYGTVHIRINGEDYRLQVYSAPGNEYHVSFRDDTSGVTTYPGGRVVFIPYPAGYDGGAFDFTLDLNRTVNGPCGYSHLTACALPPASNTIHTAIAAGEKTAIWMCPELQDSRGAPDHKEALTP